MLWGKEGHSKRRKHELSMLSDLVKIGPKHANSRTKFLLQEIKNTTKYLQSLLTFSWLFFFLSFSQGDWLIY